ncbi:flagellar protein FlaG [Paenibacillus sp. ov031]|uniref:flagellar protein FlaG n=1 Tax=Paenibacillus sp. ov031 TaxID=1761879 RepID=UPI00091DF378|nr:flagellar protein FlaG [Paenibacillus sp. ov031]SHN67111.1 flagellar protein FlaG [Paenibacillus sp. ov031]
MNIELSLSTQSSLSRQRVQEYSNNADNYKEMNSSENQVKLSTVADEQLVKTIERAIKSLQGPQTSLEISIHEKTHDIMVKVLNRETGELIREIPPEKTLDLVAKMMEIAGILIDEKI